MSTSGERILIFVLRLLKYLWTFWIFSLRIASSYRWAEAGRPSRIAWRRMEELGLSSRVRDFWTSEYVMPILLGMYSAS